MMQICHESSPFLLLPGDLALLGPNGGREGYIVRARCHRTKARSEREREVNGDLCDLEKEQEERESGGGERSGKKVDRSDVERGGNES